MTYHDSFQAYSFSFHLESKSFPEDVDFLLDTMSREKLQSLARDDAGQGSVAEDDWFR